jgi:CTP synthase
LIRKLYGKAQVSERHRHRYEVNNKYRAEFEKNGLDIVGTSPDGKLVEIMEIKDHPFMAGSQFHPELKSRPLAPHPMFLGFVEAASKIKVS